MFHPKGPSFFELARQALTSTERGYDLLAPKFDYTPFRTPDWILSVVAAQLQPAAPFDRVLDIGCGTGAAIEVFLPLCRQRMVGFDSSAGMLKVARENVGTPDRGAQVELVRGDALQMPFDAEFDLAVSFGAFGHILHRDEPRFVAQIARALKPGGAFVFVSSSMPPILSRRFLLSCGFNAAMQLRNWLVKPPFIMYYLTFLLPEVSVLLEDNGFDVRIERPFVGRHDYLRLIIARRTG